ncbi:nicotinate phosphoribosyltransferase [Gamsiella multidivaricata]|uniref:nicotinate phosphoribosyltransferase n=1 Tax=Gamsiella multidivaricata TaxID=101098 RepID=UPI002220649F|nr:nicotinate phosphoribosyltransferase [Gamsiella multidivaricata]KAG0363130.1 nicotinate phosphoribosyltransferase [Gamsiella multidivaricata]KAI7829728.1 nicotinate phosphoribosyltransferase [Gamsiella multidivaricata]
MSSAQQCRQREQNSLACTSILDNDLYKFTMQQAVRQHYPNTPCDYLFTNRSPDLAKLPHKALPWLKEKIHDMAALHLTPDERLFLEAKCPYLTKDYLDWLQNEFRFKPEEQVQIKFAAVAAATGAGTEAEKSIDTSEHGSELVRIMITGKWDEVILYEVPILALVSEAYFRFGDQDWSYDGQFEAAQTKARRLVHAGAKFAEFGTRRRRDYETQRIVLEGLIAGSPSPAEAVKTQPGQGFLTGTSNLHFAHVMNLVPIGTMAHEWYMGTAAILRDASQANKVALERWSRTYPGQVLGIALTDTFTTAAFLKAFKGKIAKEWSGVRHDSGDPFEFMDRIIQHYDQDPMVGPEMRKMKRIVFSDGLNTEKAIQLQEAADAKGIQVSFGIGTHFTNDYQCLEGAKGTSNAMNIVIKLYSCAGKECVKLSDDHGKESGSDEAVSEVKRQIGTLL